MNRSPSLINIYVNFFRLLFLHIECLQKSIAYHFTLIWFKERKWKKFNGYWRTIRTFKSKRINGKENSDKWNVGSSFRCWREILPAQSYITQSPHPVQGIAETYLLMGKASEDFQHKINYCILGIAKLNYIIRNGKAKRNIFNSNFSWFIWAILYHRPSLPQQIVLTGFYPVPELNVKTYSRQLD